MHAEFVSYYSIKHPCFTIKTFQITTKWTYILWRCTKFMLWINIFCLVTTPKKRLCCLLFEEHSLKRSDYFSLRSKGLANHFENTFRQLPYFIFSCHQKRPLIGEQQSYNLKQRRNFLRWRCAGPLSSWSSLGMLGTHDLLMLNLSNLKMGCRALHDPAPPHLSNLISQHYCHLDHCVLASVLMGLHSTSGTCLAANPPTSLRRK